MHKNARVLFQLLQKWVWYHILHIHNALTEHQPYYPIDVTHSTKLVFDLGEQMMVDGYSRVAHTAG